MRTVGVLLLLLLPSPVVAQMMHIEVQPDRVVMSDGQFVPRMAMRLPASLSVAPGQTVTLPPDSTWDAIEVAGILNVPAGSWVLRVTHLVILPGGVFNAQVACGSTGRIIFRNVPINTAVDPFQWGNGLVNFGTRNMQGCPMARTWAVLDTSVEAGATNLSLPVPDGWKSGDDLHFTDSAQAPYASFGSPNGSRRESPVRAQAVTSTGMTLSKPLDFEHHTIVDHTGGQVVRPRVQNFTRNLTIESENVAVPGHVADVGHDAHWNVQYVGYARLGRTRNEPLHQTARDLSVIGTNQPGRYTDHKHHTPGVGNVDRGNAYIGHPGAKWARVVHQTSDTLSEDNVAVDFPGGCFVTEDGNEVRNVFRRDFCSYSDGGGRVIHGVPTTNIAANCPGCEGGGGWFRGVWNTYEGFESWNNRYGMILINIPIAKSIPSTPGGPIDSSLPYRPAPTVVTPVLVSNNTSGMDYWGVPLFMVQSPIYAHNMGGQVIAGAISDNTGIGMTNPKIVCGSYLMAGVMSAKAYISYLAIDGGLIHGCGWGITEGGGSSGVDIRNVSLSSSMYDMDFTGIPDGWLTIENVRHLRPAADISHLAYGEQQVWTPAAPSFSLEGCRHKLINYNQTGLNYCLSAGTGGTLPPPPPALPPPPSVDPAPAPAPAPDPAPAPAPAPAPRPRAPNHAP